MGRIGDIADLVTGLALLGGGYLIYRAVKDAGEILPEFPVFEWPELPGLVLPPDIPGLVLPPDIPGFGPGNGVGGGGGGVRNGDNGYVPPLPPLIPPHRAPGTGWIRR